jgi:hypothetical protein
MTDTCWHCGEPVADEDSAQEEVVELPTGDGWAAVHANGCPKERLPKLLEEYREVKALLDYAQGEVDRVKAAIDQALGSAAQLTLGGFEIRRVDGTLMRKWDNRQLNALLYTLRQTENDELADTIEACRFEEPRRGYLRIGEVKR